MILTIIGNDLERYETVISTVPFVDVAAFCERKLKEAERLEEEYERMKSK